jgi:hypothetical protein
MMYFTALAIIFLVLLRKDDARMRRLEGREPRER